MKRRIGNIHNKSMCLLYYSVSSCVLYFIQIQMTDIQELYEQEDILQKKDLISISKP